MEHHFTGPSFTIGVEEELMILDAETYAQRPVSDVLIDAVTPRSGRVKTELFRSVIELNTDICASPSEAADVVAELRRNTIAAAKTLGYAIAAGGSHPFDIASQQEIADEIVRAYLLTREVFGYVLLWQSIEALDNKVADSFQADMLIEAGRLIVRATGWFLRSRRLAEPSSPRTAHERTTARRGRV